MAAKASADGNPIMIFVMRLFPAAAMTDDRIAPTNRALAQEGPCPGFDPMMQLFPGAASIYVCDPTDVFFDPNGYFAP